MPDDTPAELILSPEAEAIMEHIRKLDPADQLKLLKRMEYEDAVKAHRYQETLLQKLEEEKRKKG